MHTIHPHQLVIAIGISAVIAFYLGLAVSKNVTTTVYESELYQECTDMGGQYFVTPAVNGYRAECQRPESNLWIKVVTE